MIPAVRPYAKFSRRHTLAALKDVSIAEIESLAPIRWIAHSRSTAKIFVHGNLHGHDISILLLRSMTSQLLTGVVLSQGQPLISAAMADTADFARYVDPLQHTHYHWRWQQSEKIIYGAPPEFSTALDARISGHDHLLKHRLIITAGHTVIQLTDRRKNQAELETDVAALTRAHAVWRLLVAA